MARGGVHSFAIIYPFSFCLISLTPGPQGRAPLGRGRNTSDFRRNGVVTTACLAVPRGGRCQGGGRSGRSTAGGSSLRKHRQEVFPFTLLCARTPHLSLTPLAPGTCPVRSFFLKDSALPATGTALLGQDRSAVKGMDTQSQVGPSLSYSVLALPPACWQP